MGVFRLKSYLEISKQSEETLPKQNYSEREKQQ